jgi:hypothetical protein
MVRSSRSVNSPLPVTCGIEFCDRFRTNSPARVRNCATSLVRAAYLALISVNYGLIILNRSATDGSSTSRISVIFHIRPEFRLQWPDERAPRNASGERSKWLDGLAWGRLWGWLDAVRQLPVMPWKAVERIGIGPYTRRPDATVR